MISDLNANMANQPVSSGLPVSHTAPLESEQDRIRQLEGECARLRGQVAELEKERDDYLRGIYTWVKKYYNTPEVIEKEARELEYAMAHPETWTSSEAIIAEMESYVRELKQCQVG